LSRPLICGPFVCNFPNPRHYQGRTWTCPYCKTTYVLTRPKPRRLWRRGDAVAPYGYWRLPFFTRRRSPTAGATLDFVPCRTTPLDAEPIDVSPPAGGLPPDEWVPETIPDA
jgi:hypothetical protein